MSYKMHIFYVCVLYLLVHQVCCDVSSSVSRKITCLDDGVVSCTSDCKSRLFCMLGQILTIDCLPQTSRPFCNPDTLECGFNSTCSAVEMSDFICPDIGNYPYATDCTKFWICSASSATIGQCNNNMVFDPKSKTCNNGVQCLNFSPVKGLCKGKEGTIIVHPLSKNIYFHCSSHFPQLNTCAETLIFNTLTLKCEPECKAETVMKDPSDPLCYYSCLKTGTGIKPERKCCPENNTFDENILACMPI